MVGLRIAPGIMHLLPDDHGNPPIWPRLVISLEAFNPHIVISHDDEIETRHDRVARNRRMIFCTVGIWSMHMHIPGILVPLLNHRVLAEGLFGGCRNR